jgi:hypothetical protein
VYGKVTLHLPLISEIKASLHNVVGFMGVFLDGLRGMPPERAVEFKIELQPGTSPIAKAPYQMTPMQLVELKVQLNDLQETRVIFAQVHHLGVVRHCL